MVNTNITLVLLQTIYQFTMFITRYPYPNYYSISIWGD